MEPKEREIEKFALLNGKELQFYYENFPIGGKMKEAAKNYEAVKDALIDRLGRSQEPEDMIRIEVSSNLEQAYIIGSTRKMETV